MARSAKHPEAFPFGQLTPDEFDELVYLLAHSADGRVAKLKAPDGGLDTVRVAPDDPLIAEWGVQAKHHTSNIGWSECKKSLDRAVDVWAVRDLVFAFPRNLSQKQHELFHKHLSQRHPSVAVAWWGASKLTALLLDSEAGRGIAKRFFNAEDPAELTDRAIRAGRPLRTARDLIGHERLTGDFLRTADPHFEWHTTKRPPSPHPVPPAPDTALRLEFASPDEQLIFDAVPRSPSSAEHFAPHGAFAFGDQTAVDHARHLMQSVIEQGGRADLGEATLRFDRIPAPFDELFQDGIDGAVQVRAQKEAAPWSAIAIAETDEGTASLDFDLEPVDPEPEWDAKLCGRRHGMEMQLRFVWSHSDQHGALNATWNFRRATGTVVERAQVLAFLIALHGTGRFVLRDRTGGEREIEAHANARPVPDHIRHLQQAYDDLATIQRFAGGTFGPPPDELTHEDAANLRWLAQAVLEGEYNASVSSAKFQAGPGAAAHFEKTPNDIVVQQTLCARFFGRELPVARQTVRFPPMLLKRASRIPGPDPMWEYEVVPLSGHAVDVRIELEALGEAPARAA